MPSRVALSHDDHHFSRYNEHPSPTIQVWDNGDVDIGDGTDRIGLTQEGMFQVVQEWVKNQNYLSYSQREQLKKLFAGR